MAPRWVHNGRFIALEGGEGSGKSTTIKILAEKLTALGYKVTVTRAPGGTPFGVKMREAILHTEPGSVGISPKAALFAMIADRIQQLEEVIQPALTEGHIVLTDRFWLSSVSYQGAGLGLGEDFVLDLSRKAHGHIYPDLTIIMDVPVEVGLARVNNRGELNDYDLLDVNFHNKVRDCLLGYGNTTHPSYKLIDASRDLDTVVADVTSVVLQDVEDYL